MKEDQEVLFCNDAFYQAFLSRDINSMSQVWAKHAPVLCIHPGGDALSERDEVLSSWRSILNHRTCPRILHQNVQLFRYDGVVLATCYEWDERQPDNVLLATNGFVREGGHYRMVLHQAGPSPAAPVETDDDPSQAMH